MKITLDSGSILIEQSGVGAKFAFCDSLSSLTLTFSTDGNYEGHTASLRGSDVLEVIQAGYAVLKREKSVATPRPKRGRLARVLKFKWGGRGWR